MKIKKYIKFRNIRRLLILIGILLVLNKFMGILYEDIGAVKVFRQAYEMNITHLIYNNTQKQFDFIMITTVGTNLMIQSILTIIFMQFVIWLLFKIDDWLDKTINEKGDE